MPKGVTQVTSEHAPTTAGVTASRVPAGARIQFAHHRLRMPDGRQAGISVGGHGVPLVFFHGIGMSRRTYQRLLNRLPQLGFLVIAVDSPGHGETSVPRSGATDFVARTVATQDVLDALGIRRALLVGHSMGGRTAAELAARSPEQALATVLIDPALGEPFDSASPGRMASPRTTALGMLSAVRDTVRDRVGLQGTDRMRHYKMLGRLAFHNALHPRLFLATATAITQSEASSRALGLLHRHAIPTAVIHGERDMIIPLESAINAAQISGATLITLPEAYHSWLLPSPWTFIRILQHLIEKGLLGEELRSTLGVVRNGGMNTITAQRYLRADAPVLGLAPATQLIGDSEPRRGSLCHEYRIWDGQECSLVAPTTPRAEGTPPVAEC